jgi:hypothetical protein
MKDFYIHFCINIVGLLCALVTILAFGTHLNIVLVMISGAGSFAYFIYLCFVIPVLDVLVDVLASIGDIFFLKRTTCFKTATF